MNAPQLDESRIQWAAGTPKRLDLGVYNMTRLVVISLAGLAIVSLLVALAKGLGLLADTASVYMYMFYAEIPLMAYGIVAAVRLALHKRNAIFFCKTYTIASALIWLYNVYVAITAHGTTVAQVAIPLLIVVFYLFILRSLYQSTEIKALFPKSFQHFGMVEVLVFVLTIVCFLALPWAIVGLRML